MRAARRAVGWAVTRVVVMVWLKAGLTVGLSVAWKVQQTAVSMVGG